MNGSQLYNIGMWFLSKVIRGARVTSQRNPLNRPYDVTQTDLVDC